MKTKLAESIGVYPYTLLAALIQAKEEMTSCLADSKLKRELCDEERLKLLKTPLSKQELKRLKGWQKKPLIEEQQGPRRTKTVPLQNHFRESSSLSKRNEAIMRALKNGYTQGEVARYIGISAAMVSKIFRAKREQTHQYERVGLL
jgi:DNA-binding CsgD family transcriptional regulator